MDLQLTDRVVIVTGAASGIGQASPRVLTEEEPSSSPRSSPLDYAAAKLAPLSHQVTAAEWGVDGSAQRHI